MSKYIIAHDLGTSGNKATLFRTDGKLISSAIHAYDTHYFNGNWAEQNPEDWWEAVCKTTSEMAKLVPPEEIVAMSFSGHMMGCLALDKDGKVIRPHIMWCDMRSTEQCDRLLSKISMEDAYAIVGHRLSAAYSLEKIMWMKDHEPENYERTVTFLHAKDYMVYRLTGEMMTDYSDASGMNVLDINTFKWSEKMVELAEIDINKLPRLMPSTTVVGNILPEAAKLCGLTTNTKIVLGAGDGATASVGAGSVTEGVTYSCLGTSAWFATTTSKPIITEKMILANWASAVPGMINPIGTMQAAGGSFSWLKNCICTGEAMQAKQDGCSVYDIINDEIAKAPAGSNGILFLPYLLGERAPRWNPDAQGAFVGIKMMNDRCDLLRSVVEGIGYNLRVILDEFTSNGICPESVAAVGGLANGAVQREIFASIWNIAVSRLNFTDEAGSIGAAVIGGVGIGEFENFDAVRNFWHVVDTVEPKAELKDTYDKYLKIFNNAYDALTGVYSELAAANQN